MGEWEQGLKTARDSGIIDEATHERLTKMSFEREASGSKFPMRIALMVLGSILLISVGFAIFVRLIGDSPSQVVIATALAVVAIIFEVIARLVHRANPLKFLAGIIGSFAGIPLGFAVAVLLPNEPNSGVAIIGTAVAAIWSLLWFRRTNSGISIALVVLELAMLVSFVGDNFNFNRETTGIVLCVIGILAAVASIIGRIKPSLPPLVASLIVIGAGCIAQNTYGGDVISLVGIVISAGLFLVAYRRSEAIMSAATAVSTGIWAVVLTSALTNGSIIPLVVAAVLGAVMVAWGSRRTRK